MKTEEEPVPFPDLLNSPKNWPDFTLNKNMKTEQQRVIKFRAWDKESSCMREVIEINFKSKHFDLMLSDPTPGAPDNWVLRKFDDAILMSFTGLLDKAGKEIYEGDLLKVTAPYDDEDGDNIKIVEVKYNILAAGYTIEWSNGFCGGDADITTLGWAAVEGYEFEICGTVHQDKHLLE